MNGRLHNDGDMLLWFPHILTFSCQKRMKSIPCSLLTLRPQVPKALWLRNTSNGSMPQRPFAHRHEVMVRLIRLRRQCWRKLLAWSTISLEYSLPMVKGIYLGMRKTEQLPRLAAMVKLRWWTESPHERLGTGTIVERKRKRRPREKGSFRKKMETLSGTPLPSYAHGILLMLMMYSLLCYRGRTYLIEPHLGYWPQHSHFKAVNQNDCSTYRKARQKIFALTVSESGTFKEPLWHIAGLRMGWAFWLLQCYSSLRWP